MKKIIFIILFMISCNLLYAREHPYFIRDIKLSPDNKYIAIGRIDNKIILFDRENKKVLKVIESKTEDINWHTAFTPDSKYLVFQNKNWCLNFYNIEKGEITKRINLSDGCSTVVFFKDMKKMIWGSPSGKVEVIDLETLEKKVLKIEFPRPPSETAFAPIWHIIISPDEKYFLTITRTSNIDLKYDEPEEAIRPGTEYKDLFPNNVRHCGINLWDAKTFKKINKFMADDMDGATYAAFSKDMKHLVITSEGGITVWDLATFGLLYQKHVPSNACGFVDANSEYFAILWEGYGTGLFRLQDLINPKEPVNIKKEQLLERVLKTKKDRVWEDLIKSGYIDDKGTLQPKARNLRGERDLVISEDYRYMERRELVYALWKAFPSDATKNLKFKYEPCSQAMVTDPERNLIITGDYDGSISVYRFNPKNLKVKLEWHPRSVIAGVIRWLGPWAADPFELMTKSSEEIEEMTKQYEVNQLRIIEEDRKKGNVETRYETIQMPGDKEKEQKSTTVAPLTPIK